MNPLPSVCRPVRFPAGLLGTPLAMLVLPMFLPLLVAFA